jgi:hypothetical protein
MGGWTAVTVRYLLGAVLASVALVPMFGAANAWRKRLTPSLEGPPAVLATFVLGLAAVVVLAEVLGSVSGLRTAPITVTLAVVGSGSWYAAVRFRGGAGASPREVGATPSPAGNTGTGVRVLAIVATSVLTAGWATRTVDALHHGMTTVDTLWYHLPFAARFVQTGSITSLHYVDTQAVVPFYPETSELLHALGIIFVGNDLLSPMINLGWMAVALLAAWCIGRPFGVAPVSLIAATVLLGTPGLVATQPGGGYTDVPGAALFLASIALLITTVGSEGELPAGGIALAALAAGLSFGTKYTLVGPVAVLTLGVWVVSRRGHRVRPGALWLGLVALTGGYWYLRNWVIVANPLPSLSHLGPIKLHSPPINSPNTSVGHYLFDGSIWRRFFIPGLRSSLGPAWPALLACAAAGMVLVFFSRRNKVSRMVAVVGAGSMVAFIYTPQFLGLPGAPFFFEYNLRYSMPALLVGLVLLPLVPALARGRLPFWLGIVFLVILGVTQLDSTIWPLDLFSGPFAQPVRGIDSLLGLLVGVLVLVVGLAAVFGHQWRPSWRPKLMQVVVAAIVLVVVGLPLQQFYMSHRYDSAGANSAVAPRTVAWVQNLSHARIALGGDFMNLQYPYYGRNLSNYVQFLTMVDPDGALSPYPTCTQWLRALHAGHYDYLVTLSPSEKKWTLADPTATLIRTETISKNGILYTFRLGGPLDLSGCGSDRSGTD